MKRWYTSLLVGFCTIFPIACTGDFREINSDRAGVTDEDLNPDNNGLGYRLRIVQQGIYFNYDFGKGRNWPFQMIQNLNADLFAGYMHDPKPLLGGSNNSDYNLQEGWNSAMWEFTYSYVMPEIYRLEQLAEDRLPPFFAIAEILKVMVMQRVTDYYGPVIYSRFGDSQDGYMPDDQQTVYLRFFDDLDEAVAILSDYIDRHPSAAEFAKFDMLLDGTYASWLRLANSLRMRLAVRIAAADPERGRAEFRKAAQHPFGVIEQNTENAAVAASELYTNPLGEINRNWNEAVMNASMESILVGYDDPRLGRFFEPCLDDVALQDRFGKDSAVLGIKGEYHGIRQGTCFSHNLYAALSRLTINQTTDAVLMSAAEVWFLRAEAALRGWSDEDAGTCYRYGVMRSFEQWKTSGTEEYLESDRLAADYHDVFTPANDIAARCRVSPRWDETAAAEIKLEKIITQKWIALFPEGCEAWAEQRRTGYPRLFPVLFNHSPDRCIDTETMIRRLNFPASLATSDPERYEALVRKLDGPDHAGTRLWWDTGKNFPDVAAPELFQTP